MKKIKIFSNRIKKYEILIDFDLLNKINIFSKIENNHKIMFITNDFLFKKYFRYIIKKNINNLYYKYYIIPDGEFSKSINILNNIITALLNFNYNKKTYLIAIGGGVIGDLTGFVSSIYLRGIKYVQIPTTLLSQVDSSIGGKTAINHALGKNMIGTFYNPEFVFTDTKFLYSLPNKELLSGIAEIIKYSLILDYNFFIWIEKNIFKILKLDKKTILYCIKKCCTLKSLLINKDEKDLNIRNILNFGHTFGHAIEAFMGYGNWTHGESISAGMIIASKLSFKLNKITYLELNRIKNLILMFKLPIKGPSNMKFNDYINYMNRDKKNSINSNNKININLILLEKIGKAKIVNDININDIKYAIKNH
ncbi:3-dehydroquinate synthase [endosymbiont of Euscepes postfasciatus]|uniref:3-dehydroquinate synthase n=1 Tax=endosymbiont of Euscepes postfasciatus TaxID=650377 RepID=UPI000DC6DD21|nr:3-dehydroquinate synthase [endosymbiont of Euscepes postfasciatus]BBA84653.1 3-dehydroquinate synthase [endosymbiont of Euscepes postfasciatus]